MKKDDIRWKQRFNNLDKAFGQLADAVSQKELSSLEKAGLIQVYSFTFELAWKTLKDFLEEQGVTVKFPREIIRMAFKYELIDDGDIWMDMLDKRNLMAHTYDEADAETAVNLIVGSYAAAIKKVHVIMKEKL